MKVVINAKWHADRVRQCREWIGNSKKQIEWHEKEMKLVIDHLKLEEEWLKEALASQEEYLRSHKK